MYSLPHVIVFCLLAAFVTYYLTNRARKRAEWELTNEHNRTLAEKIEWFDDTTSQLLDTANDYANFHSENASQAIQILDTHLEETGTKLSPEYAAALEEIRYSYSYSTVH